MPYAPKTFSKPSFDPETSQIDFGGVHLNNYGVDSMARDAGMREDLISGFINTRPESDLAYAQRAAGSGELVQGGSGYQLNRPEGGYSARDMDAINGFVEKMAKTVENIQKQVEQKAARNRQLG